MKIRLLTSRDVRNALPMADAVQLMKKAYLLISERAADMPERSRLHDVRSGTQIAIMPTRLHDSGAMGLKIVGYNESNPARSLRTIHALMVVMDQATGQIAAVMDGSSLTAIRTGAGIGAATDILAQETASVLALIGSGVQARAALEAICAVRPVSEVRIFSRTRQHAAVLARHAAEAGITTAEIKLVYSTDEAVEGATIICAATNSKEPVFDGARVQEGAHINALGSYTPAMQEVDSTTVLRSKVFVDQREHALLEAGDLIVPIQEGLIDADWIKAELGEVIAGRIAGRTGTAEITLFKSVGVAVQDMVAAQAVLQNAAANGLGELIQL